MVGEGGRARWSGERRKREVVGYASREMGDGGNCWSGGQCLVEYWSFGAGCRCWTSSTGRARFGGELTALKFTLYSRCTSRTISPHALKCSQKILEHSLPIFRA